MVDEIQRVKPDAEHILKSLHLATYDLPIVPVYAGLGNSTAILDRIGLSRLNVGNGVYDIGCLSRDESMQAVEMMLKRFTVDRTGANVDWPSVIAEQSDGWPQHLHNGMRSLGFELLRTEGRLSLVNAEAAKAKDREYRILTYRRRMSPEIRRAGLLTAKILKGIPERGLSGMDITDRIDNLKRLPNDTDGRGLRLPKNMDADDFFDHLIGKCVLQDSGDGLYSCPIPSLRRFLIREGGLDSDGHNAEGRESQPVDP